MKVIKKKISLNDYPTVSGRASISNSQLIVDFKLRDQAQAFILLIMKSEINIPYEYESILTDTSTIHRVTVGEISWASNLTYIAKCLEKIEYKN